MINRSYEYIIIYLFKVKTKELIKRLFARWCVQAKACKIHLRTSRILHGVLFYFIGNPKEFPMK